MCVMWRMSLHMYTLCCFVDKLGLLRFTLFCRGIYFAAIYALLCGEKNDKYEVWFKGTFVFNGHRTSKDEFVRSLRNSFKI